MVLAEELEESRRGGAKSMMYLGGVNLNPKNTIGAE